MVEKVETLVHDLDGVFDVMGDNMENVLKLIEFVFKGASVEIHDIPKKGKDKDRRNCEVNKKVLFFSDENDGKTKNVIKRHAIKYEAIDNVAKR